ncbi:LOW QUALITY PROTEIN: hypothetical protein PHMEG_00021961 [Phytophthora megakarya]|uniref:Uncharacterized protein n=1 Tax=Phytophthora megakarya TaxID=4795 RepID=A0A225VMW5_9STRA|nr:LOW QUALITY PROTEIN: hypothetical protein PHMEG_00021961 [Phytophthora megakarya]
MSSNGTEDISKQANLPDSIRDTDVHGLNVSSDPFELFEGAHSISNASDAHERGSWNSDAISERLERLEGLLKGMARQQATFMVNQLKHQEEMKCQADPRRTTPSEHSFDGSSTFTGFIRARDRRMRLGSLDEPMHTASPPRVPPQYQPPQPQLQSLHTAQQDVQPNNFGLKIPKPKDLDWSVFSKFSDKESYADADFKSWGLRFLHRRGAAQQMSSGDWTEEFKILALSGKLESTALVYFEQKLPGWTAVSNTLEYVINSILML